MGVESNTLNFLATLEEVSFLLTTLREIRESLLQLKAKRIVIADLILCAHVGQLLSNKVLNYRLIMLL